MENDLISRAELGIGKCDPNVFNNWTYGDGWNACIEIIEAAPAVDAVPVVRCRDCKWWTETVGQYIFVCSHDRIRQTQPEFYCAYGERKEPKE